MTTPPDDTPERPEAPPHDETRTRIIRRAPTTPLPPVTNVESSHVPPRPPDWERAAAPRHVSARPGPANPWNTEVAEPAPRTVVAACAVSMISGWATAVVATDLIAGWWRTDRLFCMAVGFLALVFATATVTGVITLLQRRALGRYLLLAGAVVAFLTYLGIFIAGARVAWVVHLVPVLPIATVVLVVLPETKRWLGVD
ncbi:hypothetical protein [Mycobacterium botniense]|uniref:hypothetical protein n=1 Tax=Mycobacterium botniense TaxID=84962 RepID=UPI001FE677BA|nr:hypothetical protein [Mycobacterium botniense]